MTTLTVSTDYHPEALRRFNADVDEHEMTVKHDQGLYRHLRFKDPKHSFSWFDIITWPGNLTIRGDMGCYTFARTDDMFEFFGDGTAGRAGYVNAHYWGEKLQAEDTGDGYRKHSEDNFKRWVIEDFWDRRSDFTREEAKEVWAAIREQILDDYVWRGDSPSCKDLLESFRSESLEYHDVWELDFTDYSFRYLWCCHAILWGIKQYRSAKAENLEAVPTGAASVIQEQP